MYVDPAHLELIPKIYDTVTSPEEWRDVLEEFSGFCGAGAASLMLGDIHNEDIGLRCLSASLNLEDFQVYENGVGKEDAQAMGKVLLLPRQTWMTDEEAWGKPPSEIEGNKLLTKLFGLNRRVGCRLSDSKIWMDGVSLNFKSDRGNLTAEEDQISQIFLPHMAKAIELTRPFLLLQQKYNAILSVLDKLQLGMVVVTSGADVVISNREADRILDARNGLFKGVNGKISVQNGDLQSTLLHCITNCVNQPLSNENRYISIPRKSKDTPLLLEIVPLVELDGDIDGRFKGCAIFLIDPDKKEMISTQGLAKIFQLSQSENEVCDLLTRGYKMEEVAEVRNTSRDTVKTQLKSIFIKTDTTRQTDLVRLALKVNIPVDRE